MNKKRLLKNKLMLVSSIGVLSISIPFVVNIFQKNNYSSNNFSINSLKQDSSGTSGTSTNFDYTPIANNVNVEPVSTTVGFLGINSDNNTLYLTSYESVTVWQIKINDQTMVKQFYSTTLKVSDISTYTIKSWKYLEDSDIIALILSAADGTNATVLGVKADTGLLYAPILDSNGIPKPSSNMVQVNDGTNVLWENSNKQIVASIFGNYNTYSTNTFLISFSKNGVSRFTASIRNIAVDPDNALAKKNELVAKRSETINNKTITYTDKTWDKGDGSRWYLQALIKGTANSGTNIAIFSDDVPSLNVTSTTEGSTVSETRFQQAVLVDDSLNPILNGNNKIALTLSKLLNLNYSWNTLQKIPKYGYLGLKNGTLQNFIWVTSGTWNAVTQITYDSSANTLVESKVYDLQHQSDQDIKTFSYDLSTNRLFTSNTYSTKNAAIGYIDFNDTTLDYKVLVPSSNQSSYVISNELSFAPVYSETGITETPLVYFDTTTPSKIIGLYFENGSASATSVDLLRKTYSDIQTKAESLSWYKTKSASTITNDEALQALVYDINPSNGNFSNEVETLNGNDEYGTLNVRYKTTYSNWWNTSTKSNFFVETTITGMYATSDSSFSFVTVNNGNTDNDNKLSAQNTLKESTYPSNVKWSDVSTYFAIANIKNISGSVIPLEESMITLEPDNANGTLKITVDYSSKLPTGLSNDYLVYENVFSGFLNLQGYDYHVLTNDEQSENEQIKNIKQNSYPSELTVSQYLDNFVQLGKSYSKNINDWDFNVVPDDYGGSLTVSLTYNPKTNPLPTDFPETNKNIVENIQITGFKNITDNFKNITVKSYVGIKNADDIWNEYSKIVESGQSNFISTTLSSLISVPYVDNFSDLTITRNNSDNSNELNLTVAVKEGTITRLLVNRQNFTFDSTTASNFQSNGLTYPYQVKINIETVEQSFLWKKPDGQTVNYTSNEAQTIKINLADYEYETINSNMYADQVTEQDIRSLFEAIGFINIKILLQADNQDGIVYATISLNSTDNFDVQQNSNVNQVQLKNSSNHYSTSLNATTNTIPDGSMFVKRFEITGFKKPISPVVIAISASVAAVVLLFFIIFLVYLKVIRKNLHKVIINKEDKKFVKKLDNKDQTKKNRILKHNKKLQAIKSK